MERTVPSTGSEEIELYQRTYYSLLRSSTQVKIRTLEEVHAGMNSLLHPAARQPVSDIPAFIYSILRLPTVMHHVKLVVMGQSAAVFEKSGYTNLNEWQEVFAPARRRRCFLSDQGVLACLISSRTDIDDVIPLLTAYQIEWNKLHNRLQTLPDFGRIQQWYATPSGQAELSELLEIKASDFERLATLWGDSLVQNLQHIAKQACDIKVQLLSGSLIEYRRATNDWWENVARAAPELYDRPVYFVSSNSHSVLNILSGYAPSIHQQLMDFLKNLSNEKLLAEWQTIEHGNQRASRENFLYYLLKKYQNNATISERSKILQHQAEIEHQHGIQRIPSQRSFDIEVQVFDLARIKPEQVDSRLISSEIGDWMCKSDALILNIDYPLGLAAYDILTEIASQAGQVLGVYVMGKAATLNAIVGDVMISNVVHDEHSSNTYLFPNCFSSADVAGDLVFGTVLDNQKAVTVQGTFLQNKDYMDVFYREGYTVIEMEAGPYLSAVYEMHRPKRHPVNEMINLYSPPFDLGLIHYASDTPLGKGKNLGAGSLSYFGMDATYAVTLAILRRIFSRERERIVN
jgi:hypothetical protein